MRGSLVVCLLALVGCKGLGASGDVDGDGFTVDEDCDDGDAAVNPDAAEVCDGVDNDCDGEVDGPEATDAVRVLADADDDGFGDPATEEMACEAPEGWVVDDGSGAADCDDSDPAVHPGADERCDTVADDDCDGEVNEDDAADAGTWYADADGDGFGDPSVATVACTLEVGVVEDASDCDDADADVHPGAPEWCDQVDTDCDGVLDPAGRVTSFDADGSPSDATATFADGTSTTPAMVTLTEPGAYGFCEGTWFVSITLASDGVTLRGAGEESTQLTGGANLRALTITSSDAVRIEDLTIADGQTSLGGAGALVQASEVTMQRVTVRDCEASNAYAGGIWVRGGSLTLVDSTLQSNSATGSFAGAMFAEETVVTFEDVDVLDNFTSQRGGGILALDAELSISGGTFARNVASTQDGGAIRIFRGSSLVVNGTTFDSNVAGGKGGAIAAYDRTTMSVTNASFSSNRATEGGAMHLGTNADEAAVNATSFSANTPDDVRAVSNSYSLGSDETFACVAGVCN